MENFKKDNENELRNNRMDTDQGGFIELNSVKNPKETVKSGCCSWAFRRVIQSNTWVQRDMEFIFEHSTWYLISEISCWTLKEKFYISKQPCIILFYFIL